MIAAMAPSFVIAAYLFILQYRLPVGLLFSGWQPWLSTMSLAGNSWMSALCHKQTFAGRGAIIDFDQIAARAG